MNIYQVDITVADDPDASEMLFLDQREVVARFPWTRPLITVDPDTFSANVVTGLTNIKIYATYWPDYVEADGTAEPEAAGVGPRVGGDLIIPF
jgi:hypothetical protein